MIRSSLCLFRHQRQRNLLKQQARTFYEWSSQAKDPNTVLDDDENDASLLRTAAANVIIEPMRPYPTSPTRRVPLHINKPLYASSGFVLGTRSDEILIHNKESIHRMRQAGRLARLMLEHACRMVQNHFIISSPKGCLTTDQVDEEIHNLLIHKYKAYPSPLNYSGFPKSICSSVNEVICHGIPDGRPLQLGDVLSFDVSCFYNGVHGDNCATILVGDPYNENGVFNQPDNNNMDDNDQLAERSEQARTLIRVARQSLEAGIQACRPGGFTHDIGNAIQNVVDANGCGTVKKYFGHGISDTLHHAPYIKHFANNDQIELLPGMIFTIEPMITAGSSECREWDDGWTVVTCDGSLAAQFEHTVLITEEGVEILTALDDEK